MVKKVSTLFALLLVLVCAAHAQTALTSTSLAQAVNANQTSIYVSSATGFVQSNFLVVDGEMMQISTNYTTGTLIPVRRGVNGTVARAHVSGANVLQGNGGLFGGSTPSGACTPANTVATPFVVVNSLFTVAQQWLCSSYTGSWVPGWGNTSAPAQPTATVASAAGLITPSGPLFHVTGTAAITGFTLPAGFQSGGFCVVPDGIFTWTNANNIAVAGTAVVSKTLCFTYDVVTAKFYPSYVD